MYTHTHTYISKKIITETSFHFLIQYQLTADFPLKATEISISNQCYYKYPKCMIILKKIL